MRETYLKYNYHRFIKSIALGMSEENNRKLKEFELTTSQGLLLGCIYYLNRDEQQISRRKLQEQMQMSGPSITSLLNGLEKKGFIIRQAGEMDGRTFRLAVTAKGKQLIWEMDEVFLNTEEQILKGFAAQERKLFLDLLERAWKNLNDEEAP